MVNKFDVDVIDDQHAKIALFTATSQRTQLARNRSGQFMSVDGEAHPAYMGGADDFVTIKAKGEEAPAKHGVRLKG